MLSAELFAGLVLSQPVKYKHRLDEIKHTIKSRTFFTSTLDVGLRQIKVTPGVRDDFFFFAGGDKLVVVLEAPYLAPYVGTVTFVEIKQLQ